MRVTLAYSPAAVSLCRKSALRAVTFEQFAFWSIFWSVLNR